MNRNILILSTAIASVLFMGAGCSTQVSSIPTTPVAVATNNTCTAEGQSAVVGVSCCTGLEVVAADHAAQVCGKPGSGYVAKACMSEGETPFIDTPKCCVGLVPAMKDSIYVCVKAPKIETSVITYYILDKPKLSTDFCNGEKMDSVGYKRSLGNKISKTVTGDLTAEDKIINTLTLGARTASFNSLYSLTSKTTFANGVVTMHSANGWAGSSIFYCAWKPFVERNLEQFSEVKDIKWEITE